jgi:hypothetical protein
MAEITFVNVESETVDVKEECVEEEDPLSVSLGTKGSKYIYRGVESFIAANQFQYPRIWYVISENLYFSFIT